MTDVAALLVTLQLTDSAFPAGFYTLSHGLEGYAQTGSVTPATLPELLTDLLRHSVGPADATALALAHNAVRDGDREALHRVDRRLHATKLNRELRRACTRTGHQMLAVARETFGRPAIERFGEDVAAKRSPAHSRWSPGWSRRRAGWMSRRRWPVICSRSPPAWWVPRCGCGSPITFERNESSPTPPR